MSMRRDANLRYVALYQGVHVYTFIRKPAQCESVYRPDLAHRFSLRHWEGSHPSGFDLGNNINMSRVWRSL